MQLDPLAVVTLGLAIAGAIWYLSDVTTRVRKLEEWRGELRQELQSINAGIQRLERLIRGEE